MFVAHLFIVRYVCVATCYVCVATYSSPFLTSLRCVQVTEVRELLRAMRTQLKKKDDKLNELRAAAGKLFVKQSKRDQSLRCLEEARPELFLD